MRKRDTRMVGTSKAPTKIHRGISSNCMAVVKILTTKPK